MTKGIGGFVCGGLRLREPLVVGPNSLFVKTAASACADAAVTQLLRLPLRFDYFQFRIQTVTAQ